MRVGSDRSGVGGGPATTLPLMSYLPPWHGHSICMVSGLNRVRQPRWVQVESSARSGAPEEQSAAWALVHALEHLREHSGQIGLTRQVWEQRAR